MFRLLIFIVITLLLTASAKLIRLNLDKCESTVSLKSRFITADVDHHGKNYVYVTDISIGCPPQWFRVLVDTGASDNWVATTDCVTDFCKTARKFNRSKSLTTHYYPTIQRNITFGSGSVEGILGIDTFNFAGVNVEIQRFILAHTVRMPPIFELDGYLGLGLDINSHMGKPIVEQMYRLGIINKKLFSLQLTKTGGQLIFGIDNSLYNGDIKYVNMTSDAEYFIHVNKFSVGNILLAENFHALVDSGAPYIFVPHAIYSEIDFYTSNRACNILPDITFVIGGRKFTLTHKDYSDGVIENNNCNIDFLQEPYDEIWVLGEPFLKKFYTIFDIDNMRLGFAKNVIRN